MSVTVSISTLRLQSSTSLATPVSNIPFWKRSLWWSPIVFHGCVTHHVAAVNQRCATLCRSWGPDYTAIQLCSWPVVVSKRQECYYWCPGRSQRRHTNQEMTFLIIEKQIDMGFWAWFWNWALTAFYWLVTIFLWVLPPSLQTHFSSVQKLITPFLDFSF